MTLLDDIKLKVRKLTGSPDESQLTDTDLENAINVYYQYDFPSQLKLMDEFKTISIFTAPNIDVYAWDTDLYYDVQPPGYVDGYILQYLQDKAQFYKVWPKLKYLQTGSTGDGVTAAFSFTVSATPFLQSFVGNAEKEVLVGYTDTAGNSISMTDTPTNSTTGTLSDSGGTNTGTVNYSTGAITLALTSIPGDGEEINVHVTPYVPARPQTLWFFQNQFTCRPVPDQQYEIVLSCHLKPVPLLSAANPDPNIASWWQLLAFGTARTILINRLDVEQQQALEPFYQEQLMFAERRTLMQIANQRGATIFSSPPNISFDLYNPTSGGN